MTPPDNTEVWVAFALFVLSEAIGMSRLKSNGLVEFALHLLSELFPYEIQRKQPASRANRPRPRRTAPRSDADRD